MKEDKDDKGYRFEIVANHTIEEALIDAILAKLPNFYYTLIPTVEGRGTSGSRLGDGVWPEENFVLITYVQEKDADTIISVVKEIKSLYPIEGIKMFSTKAHFLI